MLNFYPTNLQPQCTPFSLLAAQHNTRAAGHRTPTPSPSPRTYKQYYFFVNLQLALDRSLMGLVASP